MMKIDNVRHRSFMHDISLGKVFSSAYFVLSID